MTYGAFASQDFAYVEFDNRQLKQTPHLAVFVTTLTMSVMAGLGLLYARDSVQQSEAEATAIAAAMSPVSRNPVVRPVVAKLPAAVLPLRRYAGLIVPQSAGRMPVTFAQSAPLRANFEPLRLPTPAAPITTARLEASDIVPPLSAGPDLASDIPLPAPRPPMLATGQSPLRPTVRQAMVQPQPAAPPAVAPPDAPSLLQRLFGATESPALAYAPADGGLGMTGRIGSYDRYTAIYDIAAHTVYLPNGARLEAHSGIGASKDNPNSVTEHMRGATPPTVYDLSLRESLFHGVQALRLNPLDANATHGRLGLLAHTYMLGPHGDSNGCVVFRDYQAFLRAYQNGEVRRLAVVASMR